jgi:hypothetical protein
MATKSGLKGRYICKVGHLDVYANDSMRPKKNRRASSTEVEVGSTAYNLYHSKRLVEKGMKTKDEAITKALEVLGEKYRAVYGL